MITLVNKYYLHQNWKTRSVAYEDLKKEITLKADQGEDDTIFTQFGKFA